MSRFRGILEIDVERCKGCSLCVISCPFGCLALDGGINAMGYHPAGLTADAERCTGCAQCALMCPDVCITVSREERG